MYNDIVNALLNSALESSFATFDEKELYPTKQENKSQRQYLTKNGLILPFLLEVFAKLFSKSVNRILTPHFASASLPRLTYFR